MGEVKKYWFPAKKYGWGWGFPKTWQGWLVLLTYIAILGIIAFIFRPEERPFSFYFSLAIATVILIVICLIKGEPPRWRWGGKKRNLSLM